MTVTEGTPEPGLRRYVLPVAGLVGVALCIAGWLNRLGSGSAI